MIGGVQMKKITLLVTLGVLVASILLLNMAIAEEQTYESSVKASMEKHIKVKHAVLCEETARPGGTVELRISLENEERDLDEVKVVAVIPELGVRYATTNFELDSTGTKSKPLFLDIPEDAKPGVYTVRITVSSGEGRHRVIHRDIIVA